jgi:hypothetical protein
MRKKRPDPAAIAISPADLEKAQAEFEAHETRDIFYRAATELVRLARQGATSLSVAEALGVLLQTWNRSFYRFTKFDEGHLAAIERLVREHQPALAPRSHRRLTDLALDEEKELKVVFDQFEGVLGPVGAAKSLHLLAPAFFPLWDRAIAEAYGEALGSVGANADHYWRFMLVTREQCRSLEGRVAEGKGLLKAIDQYNYCRFTRGWL